MAGAEVSVTANPGNCTSRSSRCLPPMPVEALHGKSVAHLWQVTTCRGEEGGCPFALIPLSVLKRQIEAELDASGWDDFLRRHRRGPLLPHHRLSVAVAACPNACSRPQIQDVGFVATVRPLDVQPTCTACGLCERTCREQAIAADGDVAFLQPRACLACGECVRVCPVNAIVAEPLHFRVMVGGRMGRHPRWATELSGSVLPGDVPCVMRRIVGLVMAEMGGEERISDLVERIGPRRMREAIAPV